MALRRAPDAKTSSRPKPRNAKLSGRRLRAFWQTVLDWPEKAEEWHAIAGLLTTAPLRPSAIQLRVIRAKGKLRQ